MSNITHHPTEPLPVRLMMATVFLPIVLACLGIICLFVSEAGPEELPRGETLFGIPILWFGVWVIVIVPVACFALVLWRGWWRPVIILLTLNFLLGFYFAADNPYVRVAPEKRLIRFDGINMIGADVYCNGVLLGQAPLKITVAELRAKVPEWTTPPEQKWFVDRINPVYTWYPWDRFERERYDTFRFLDAKKSTLDFDTASKYWWKVESNGATWCFCDRRRGVELPSERNQFDRVTEYRLNHSFLPAKQAILDVLVDSYDLLDTQEKTIWAEYLLTLDPDWYWNIRTSTATEFDEILKPVARIKYGFEENPSEAECREILTRIIRENRSNHAISSGQYEFGFGFGSPGHVARGALAAAALQQLGDNATEPIRQMLNQHWFDAESSPAVLFMALNEHGATELYDDLVRFYAKTDASYSIVFAPRDNERVLPLFRTVLGNRTLQFLFSKDAEANTKIRVMSGIGNKELEPTIRDEIVRLLKKSNNTWVFRDALREFVQSRPFWLSTPEEREELMRWVESLPVDPTSKSDLMEACGIIHVSGDLRETPWGRVPNFPGARFFGGATGARLLFLLDEKPITTAMLLDWLREHPGREIMDYYREIAPKVAEQDPTLVVTSLQGLIRDPSPEAGDVLKEYWNDPDKKELLTTALMNNFQVFRSSGGGFDYRTGDRENVRLQGLYYDLINEWGRGIFPETSINPFVIEMFREIDNVPLCAGFLTNTADLYIPGAAELVEQWSQWEVSDTGDNYFSNLLRERAAEALDAIRMRERIKNQSRDLLLQLAAGEITPDDLLPTPVPWVWENGKYVQK